MPKKGGSSKEAAPAAPSVRSVKIEIPVPPAPKYVPGSGPPSEPISLIPDKDSTAYILDKYVLPKLSETRPQDRRLFYYLVGFTDIPQARILIPCHKALDYVDPYEMERWERENDEKMEEQKKRLAEEAKLPATKRARMRPAKVSGSTGAIKPDISQPSPHGTSVVPSISSLSNNQHKPTLVLDSHLTGPSLSTPQKRTRPSLDQVGDSQTISSLAHPTTNNQLKDEEIRRQLFWQSTKRRLSSDYSANNDADIESVSQPLIMDSSGSRPNSSRASSSGGFPALNASGSTRVTRSSSRRPGSALSAGSSLGSGASATPQSVPGSGLPVPSSARPTALASPLAGSPPAGHLSAGIPASTMSGSTSGAPISPVPARPTRPAAKRPPSGGSTGSAAGTRTGTPIHSGWAQIMNITNKVSDFMDGATQGDATLSTPTSGAGSPVDNPLTRPSPTTPWGYGRFPVPNEQGHLHTTPPAPPAVAATEPSTQQQKRSRKEPTTSTSLPPNKKQQTSKGKGKQAAEKFTEPEQPEDEVDDKAWSVKELLGEEYHYIKGKRTRVFLVNWTGPYQPTWEPASNIEDPELIRVYREKKKNGTLRPAPVRTPFASVDEAFRGGINDEATWNRQVREQQEAEEEEKPLSVV